MERSRHTQGIQISRADTRPRESGRAERCEGFFALNLELFVFQKEVRADVFGE